MPDIHRERRTHRAEHALADIPGLTAHQRRCLAVPLTETGWHIVVEAVSAERARADAFAIGQGGVYALVFADTSPDWSHLIRVRKHAEEVCANLSLTGSQFVPHMLEVVVIHSKVSNHLLYDQFPAVDEPNFRDFLLRGEHKLSKSRAGEIAGEIAARLRSPHRISASNDPGRAHTQPDALFGAVDLHTSARKRILARPFQEWMTFLDPEQLSAVQVNYNGPARISGPAGTGKSVVALHRMARFAKRNPGRLLFTSFVKTLPRYHESGFAHLAPHAANRTQFIGLHAWTSEFLNCRGVDFNLDEGGQRDAMARTWTQARDFLSTIEDTDFQYWQDEIDRVIKGRGLTSCRQYLNIRRTGRDGIRLLPEHRKFVWEKLYQPYNMRLQEKGIDDFNDVIRKALDELAVRPLDSTEDYAMVVVDEAQDFTLQQLRLVHRIAGGKSNAHLLLVGDGQQQVYPGGWRLSDAGIPVTGRGNVLRTNYRNRAAILQFTQKIEAGNSVDDLDGGPGYVLGDSNAVLPGGKVISKDLRRSELDAELVHAITDRHHAGSDIAVIVGSKKDATHIRTLLAKAGLPALSLDKYDGTQVGMIKVGTVHRAKGMDFEAVFFITEPTDELGTLTGAARDKANLRARQRLVAASRPRDYLWVGYVS